jgi:hypothetical protein
LGNGNYRTRDTRETRRLTIEEQKTLRKEDEPVTRILMSREVEVESRFKSTAEDPTYGIECESLTRIILMLLQAQNHGLRKILEMMKSSGLILHLS